MVRRAALLGLVVVACGSSSSPNAEPPAVEAGPGGDDADVPDSSDAGHDAAPDVVVDAGPPFCASLTAKFCADFDDADPTSHWDAVVAQTGVTTVGLDTSQSTSAPISLLAASVARAKNESGFASLRKTIVGTPTSARLALSVRPSTVSFTQGAYAIADLDVTQDHVFTLYLRDDDDTGQKASLKEIAGSTITYHALSKVPPANVWTRITIDIDVAAGKATVLYGAEKILDAVSIAQDAAMMDPTFRIGAPYVFGPSDAFSINVDDVVLDF
jgi:hypothetical protein